ncbi:hypothetical protein APT65_20230 [Klebsiella pneumoniae]|nr:hypothetical protein APT65_20230 [Klebsiella pneumoniae]
MAANSFVSNLIRLFLKRIHLGKFLLQMMVLLMTLSIFLRNIRLVWERTNCISLKGQARDLPGIFSRYYRNVVGRMIIMLSAIKMMNG